MGMDYNNRQLISRLKCSITRELKCNTNMCYGRKFDCSWNVCSTCSTCVGGKTKANQFIICCIRLLTIDSVPWLLLPAELLEFTLVTALFTDKSEVVDAVSSGGAADDFC